MQKEREANIRGSSHAKMKQITDSTAESYYNVLYKNKWLIVPYENENGMNCFLPFNYNYLR